MVKGDLTPRPAYVAFFAYNFSDRAVTGKLTVVAPHEWEVSIPDRVELAAGQRKQLAMSLHRPGAKGDRPARVQLTGDFGPAGSAILSTRLQLGR
ncbi:MAG: hypothetical protein ABSF26_06310 [Thermoguttaceae bacterium]|jgi:hypothetical protein